MAFLAVVGVVFIMVLVGIGLREQADRRKARKMEAVRTQQEEVDDVQA